MQRHRTPRPRIGRLAFAAVVAVTVGAAGAACGGDERRAPQAADDRAPKADDGRAPAARGDDGPTTPEAASVTVKTFAFGPDPLRVKAGTTVRWMNEDEILHTATSAEGGFDLRLDGRGATGSATLDRPGTFAYRCTVHPGMDGVIEVS